ncbi:hypothetical protein COOONC_04041 [Cooperia oncophora]
MAEAVHFLMISAFFVSLLLPAGQACGTASGGVANKALLHFNLSPPPKYTYSDLPRHGQMTTAQAAESNADRDLQLAKWQPTCCNRDTYSHHAVEVETVQFQITGAVTVETPQPIFESQWRMFAEKIQEKLEEHRVFFTGAVMVEMF